MSIAIDITNVCLETDRLILRPWQESDLEDLFAYASVPGVGEMAGWPRHENVETSRKVLAHFMEEKNVFALEEKRTGKVIGSFGLHHSWTHEHALYQNMKIAEIGYVLSKEYWGKRLMTEAVRRVIAWCFDELHLDALTVCHFTENIRSRRVIERCGFVYCQRAKCPERYAQQHQEERQYILFPSWRTCQWIIDPEKKKEIAQTVLHALPEWFGIEESTREYIEKSQQMPFCAIEEKGMPLGFAALKIHNTDSAEIYVMGVLPAFHRQGTGRRLVEACKYYCREKGIQYLQVKTVDESGGYPEYDRTREFYLAQGFAPLECFPRLWDPWNPCLLMVQKL
ncbi:MAG: GNAT family N-acetyltransferase [Clostridiales bacterium]|nr:GNAT family N-acetyltransferase [Clostridiales bacterium]